jgi:hypothetical protein
MKVTAAEYASLVKDSRTVAYNRLEAMVKKGKAKKGVRHAVPVQNMLGRKVKLIDVVEYEILTEEVSK